MIMYYQLLSIILMANAIAGIIYAPKHSFLQEQNDPMAGYEAGCRFYHEGNYEKALAAFDAALSVKPDYAEAYREKGNTLYKLRNYQAADDAFQKAFKLKGGLSWDVYEEGWLDSMITWETALSVLDKSEDMPYKLGGWEKFSVVIDHRLHAGVIEPIYLDTDNPKAYYNLGVAYYVNAGRPELHKVILQSAAESFKKAVSLKEDYADAFNYLGNAYDGLHQYEDAVAAYERAIEIDPKMAEPHNGRGLALTSLHRYAEAIQSFEKALDLKPDFYGVYFNLALAYNDSGNISASLFL